MVRCNILTLSTFPLGLPGGGRQHDTLESPVLLLETFAPAVLCLARKLQCLNAVPQISVLNILFSRVCRSPRLIHTKFI